MRYVLLALIVLAGCRTTTPAPEPARAFSAQMQDMAADVRALVPFLYDRAAFARRENRGEVERRLTDFAKVSHRVEPKVGEALLGDELLVERTLDQLRGDVNRALSSYQQGQFEFARSVAKSSLSNCFQCHSVSAPGRSAAWDLSDLPPLKLQALERADLLVATRKYDQALAFMEERLTSADFRRDFAFDFEALLRRYLALVIRVKAAPTRALAELDRVAKDGPGFVTEQVEAWRKSLRSWANERKRPVRTAADVFQQAQRHLSLAARAQQFERDHAGDVEYLRATAILHAGLKLLTTPADRARAMYLLGRAYEVLDDLGSWNLHEGYYEACLRRDPKGKLARACYDRLEASLYMGFSGSAGTHLPAEEIDRLRTLRDLL